MNLFKYLDAFRIIYSNDIVFTYVRPHQVPSRLDHAYVPPAWHSKIKDVEHFATLSDHKCLALTLEIDPMGGMAQLIRLSAMFLRSMEQVGNPAGGVLINA